MTQSDIPVEVLIAHARTDRSALGRLLERYHPYLWVVARQQIGPKLAVRSDASDIVQETMLDAHQSFAEFRGASEPEFSEWIQRIHGYNLRDAVKKHVFAAKRRIDKERPLVTPDPSASILMLDPNDNQSSPSQRLIKGEQALRLAEILESLPEMQREVVFQRHLEGWHVDEIAKHLGRSQDAIAGLLRRGIATRAARMSEESLP